MERPLALTAPWAEISDLSMGSKENDKGSALEVRPIFGLHLFVSAYAFMKDLSLDFAIVSMKSAGSLHFFDEFFQILLYFLGKVLGHNTFLMNSSRFGQFFFFLKKI